MLDKTQRKNPVAKGITCDLLFCTKTWNQPTPRSHEATKPGSIGGEGRDKTQNPKRWTIFNPVILSLSGELITEILNLKSWISNLFTNHEQ